jgi:hypothetical protein
MRHKLQVEKRNCVQFYYKNVWKGIYSILGVQLCQKNKHLIVEFGHKNEWRRRKIFTLHFGHMKRRRRRMLDVQFSHKNGWRKIRILNVHFGHKNGWRRILDVLFSHKN